MDSASPAVIGGKLQGPFAYGVTGCLSLDLSSWFPDPPDHRASVSCDTAACFLQLIDGMSRLILSWFYICLLRAGPQDIPASRELLGLGMAGYTLVSFLLSLPAYPLVTAGQLALLDATLLIVFAATALYLRRKMARFTQTLTALSGSGALLGVFALPVIQLLASGQETGQPPLLAGMLWLLLFGWSLIVVAHIMRHALSVNFPVAVVIAMLYTLVAMQVVNALFPMSQV
jgi:hypothetical protein